jgi:Protein of unknown function (DUF2854)
MGSFMMFRPVSLAFLGLIAGAVLTVMGFAAYFADNATLNLVGFFYGIPLLLGGLAFRITELKPVPLTQPTTPEVAALRKQQATKTQNQILKDITRFRYGQRAHLDSSLKHLGLEPTEEECPIVVGVGEGAIAGAYALTVEFNSPLIPFSTWQEKQEKMTAFFGPNVRVELANPAEHKVNLTLITTPDPTQAPTLASEASA